VSAILIAFSFPPLRQLHVIRSDTKWQKSSRTGNPFSGGEGFAIGAMSSISLIGRPGTRPIPPLHPRESRWAEALGVPPREISLARQEMLAIQFFSGRWGNWIEIHAGPEQSCSPQLSPVCYNSFA